MNNLYGFAVIRPQQIGQIEVIPIVWYKSLWYSFTSGLYKFLLLCGFSVAFTIATQPEAVYGLFQYLLS